VSQTKTENFTKQVPIAIAALGQHIHEHQLPIPASIDVYPTQQVLRVRIMSGNVDDQKAWVDSAIVESEINEAIQDSPVIGYRTTWRLRLPDVGVVFELVAFRAEPMLAAVPA